MALILGVKIGDVVDVAERWVALLSIDTRSSATLIGSGGEKITVSSDQMTQVAPDVWIGLGPDPATSRLRLVFDAPRHIPITRRLISASSRAFVLNGETTTWRSRLRNAIIPDQPT